MVCVCVCVWGGGVEHTLALPLSQKIRFQLEAVQSLQVVTLKEAHVLVEGVSLSSFGIQGRQNNLDN